MGHARTLMNFTYFFVSTYIWRMLDTRPYIIYHVNFAPEHFKLHALVLAIAKSP